MEMMIAIVLFTMVIGAVYSTWLLILRASRASQEAAAQVQRQRVAVHTIEDALTCIQSFQASMKYYSFLVSGNPPELRFTARLPDNFPRHGKFGDLDVRQLDFTLAPGADASRSETDLILRQRPILLDLDDDEKQHPLILARYVQKFSVECWDTNRVEWVKAWEMTNAIPPLIRVNLVLGGNRTDEFGNAGPTRSISRVIAVPSQTMPAEAQSGRGPIGGPPAAPIPAR